MLWLAHYFIKAEDEKGPWELLTKDLPNSAGYKKLKKEYGDRLSYTGLYAVGQMIRRNKDNDSITEFK